MADTNSSVSIPEHLGPYELRGELGRGAMAVVWRAWDSNLEREVALKEPLFEKGLSQDVRDEMSRRFVQEAKAAARLNHPNIVQVHTADVYDGRPAIDMELLDGASLADLIDGRAMAPASVLNILDQLLDAVGYAHSQGVVHRDIKPDNVFVGVDGRVKLADFGIAHVDGGAATRATVAGTVLGTPGYMSPEQATGAPVDSRSDLFSIGVLAHEMLTGSNPFGTGDTTVMLYRIVHEPAPELPVSTVADLPVDLRPAIMAALSKDPAARPQTAEQFKAMLHGGAVSSNLTSEIAPTMQTPIVAVPTAGITTGAATTAPVAKASGGTRSGLPKWLPYVAIAAVCLIAVGVFFAMSQGGQQSSGVPVQYTVHYVDKSTGDELKTVTDMGQAGDVVTLKAAKISGYVANEKKAGKMTLSPTGENESTVYYTKLVSYKVRYVDTNSKSIKKTKTVKKQKVGKTVSAKAPSISKYTLLSDKKKSIKLKADSSENVITFKYRKKVKKKKAAIATPSAPSVETAHTGTALYSYDSSGVNVRSEPDHNSTLVASDVTTVYWSGGTGTGYGSDGLMHTWYYIETPGGRWGYVRSDLVGS